MAQTNQRAVFCHQSILELRPSVASNERRKSATPHNTAGKHPASVLSCYARRRFNQDAVTKATDVGHRVLTSVLG